MDIPNLSVPIAAPAPVQKYSFIPVLIILVLAVSVGFWLSRLAPLGSSGSNSSSNSNGNGKNIISADKISSAADLVVGKYYGNTSQNFKDSALGTIQKGGINGEGTHTLLREGGSNSIRCLNLFGY
jgi:hypothetical protein